MREITGSRSSSNNSNDFLAIPSAPSSGARLSVSLRRLSDKDIKQYISPPKSSDVQANQVAKLLVQN